MLTSEDIQAHDRLLGAIAKMSIERPAEAYRIARRDYEPLLMFGSDSLMWTKTFDHAGRVFEIRAETYADPTYWEAIVFEGGRLAEWQFAGGQRGFAAIGVTFAERVGPNHEAAAKYLMAVAETELRRRQASSEDTSKLTALLDWSFAAITPKPLLATLTS